MKKMMDPASRTLRPRYKDLRLLVVEDNVFMRALFSDVLRAIGFSHVQMAPDGWDALDILPRFNPDLIMTDLRMERMDGLELTRLVRRAPDVPNNQVPIILVTGATGRDTIQMARDAGINEILAKPVSPVMIMSRIEQALLAPREFVISPVYTGPCRRRRSDKDYLGTRRRGSDGVFKQDAAVKALANRIRGIWSLPEADGSQHFPRAEVIGILEDTNGFALRTSDMILLKTAKHLHEALSVEDPDAVDAALEIGLQAILQLLQIGTDRADDRMLVANNVSAMCAHIRRAA